MADEPPPWATKLFNELKGEMTTLRNDLELRMTNLEQRMTELETNMRYITALTSFDTSPINNHFPQAGSVTRAELDVIGLSARLAAIERLVARDVN